MSFGIPSLQIVFLYAYIIYGTPFYFDSFFLDDLQELVRSTRRTVYVYKLGAGWVPGTIVIRALALENQSAMSNFVRASASVGIHQSLLIPFPS